MSKRIIPPPPIKPDIPEEGFKAIGNPAFQKWAEDLSIWREGVISLLPQMRKEKKEAAERGDQAEVDRLQKEYQEILDLLSKN